jgi:hypothetical protein
MTGNQPDAPLLDEARAVFITHRVSMGVASCDTERVPSLVRAHGCRVSADRRQVTVFVSVPRAAAVLRDLRAGGAIAVVFSLPRTHETIQLKGTRASIVPLEDGDHARIKAYAESFMDEIRYVGYKESFARALISSAEDESVGVMFVQTPGPNAGSRLEPKP